MTMQELFRQDGSWTQFELAIDSEGRPVSVDSDRAVSWCLLGGMYKCYGPDYYKGIPYHLLLNRLGYLNIVNYNNAKGRTIDDVRRLCQELNI